jgi:hypothetical protein
MSLQLSSLARPTTKPRTVVSPMPNRGNIPVATPPAGATPQQGFNPGRAMEGYLQDQIGSTRSRTGFGKGTKIVGGPYSGQQKGEVVEKLRAGFEDLSPDQKQLYIDRSTGATMQPGYQKPRTAVAPMGGGGSGPGGGLRTGSVQGAKGGLSGQPDYSALDWSKANRTTGDELAAQERNVAQTGDRNKMSAKDQETARMAKATTDSDPLAPASSNPYPARTAIPRPSAPEASPIAGEVTPQPSGVVPGLPPTAPTTDASAKPWAGKAPDPLDEEDDEDPMKWDEPD